jgi:hypothetical protein
MTDKQLDISNFKAGMTFKNRGELCRSLGVTPANGKNPITAQDKEFRRYFDFERIENSQGKITHGIKIIEVYDSPRPKEQGNYQSIYSNYIKLQLLNYLASEKNENGDHFVSKHEVVKMLGFVNEDYYNYRCNIERLIDYILQDRHPEEWLIRQKIDLESKAKFKIDLESINYAKFFQESSNAINGYLDTAFKGLVKLGVECKKTYLVKYCHKEPMREAEQDTQDKIKEQFDETLKEFNCKELKIVYLKQIEDKFLSAFKKKLSKNLGIFDYRFVYKFTFTKGIDDKVIQGYANTDEETLLAAKDSIRREFKARMSKNPEWTVITDYVIDDLNFSPLQ